MTLSTEWKDTYLLGIPEIDHQHQYFLLLIRRLDEMIRDNRPLRHLIESIDELIKYATFHFKSEENLMDFAGYPDLFHHKISHLKLLEELRIENMKFAHQQHDSRQIIAFLLGWFADHTVGEDLKFKEFLDLQP